MDPSFLQTDGYKFSMAEAGYPLRQETFYYSHRRGGPHLLPFDVEEAVRSLLPAPPTSAERDFLETSGYSVGRAIRAALAERRLTIRALPRGAWFFDREPAFSITGPAALVSWLEPLVLQLHYRIQVATLARRDSDRLARAVARVTCDRQREIVLETLDRIGLSPPKITVDSQAYADHVLARVRGLVDVVQDPSRIFEVGLRAATCPEQHLIALQACAEAGVRKTSNVAGARALGMQPVGTMGHEHVQRFRSDEDAFRSMRDRLDGPVSFLLDTYSTIHSGLPVAFDLLAEDPSRPHSVRFDSGDKQTQFLVACAMARSRGVRPRFILEDGFDVELTATFESLRSLQELPPEDVVYGYGGYIVRESDDQLGRDRVAAVFKVSSSAGEPTMKFGDAPGGGKASIPGEPVLTRRFDGCRWSGLVQQHSERTPRDAVRLTGMAELPARLRFTAAEAEDFAKEQGPHPPLSARTQEQIEALTQARHRAIIQSLR
ncbi:MAG: nicotinate phosphoribosyltransferase [Deltaproteobacteria bacterium]|nr:MAG: nicotinate phosphoribosyltransferase [Deltaproteobacteria bacterium]